VSGFDLVVVFLAMGFAGVVGCLLGDSGTMLLTRIAGLLLSAIAVEMIARSIETFVSAASVSTAS
jgi:multiple antibiotic resistance protein